MAKKKTTKTGEAKPEKKEATKKGTVTIQSELKRIQKEISVPKNKGNEYGGFKYRSAEDILAAYKKVSGETFITFRHDIDNKANIPCMTVFAKIQLVDTDSFIEVPGTSHFTIDLPKMSSPQASGASHSYAKKYALENLFAIDDEKLDPDNHAPTEAEQKAEEEMEQYETDVAMIDNLDALKEYWEAHKDKKLGKKFTALITKRKAQLLKESKDVNADA